MKDYVKPTIIPTTGLGEGVYMASGAAGAPAPRFKG